jgi:ubiquinone/menaquinone biosynthesis C-methylase UbiE
MTFDNAFTAYARSAKIRELFTTVFDETLPPEVEPFSFVPADGMRLIAERLALSAGDRLLDLACGRGGPGMWIARETGTALTGVDQSKVAVEHATARQTAFGLDERAEFTVGEFGALAAAGIADSSVGGVLCVDAVQFAPDLLAALADIYRVLRPGKRFVLTIWDGPRTAEGRYPEDLHDRLVEAGFRDVEVTEHPEWEERRRAVYEAGLALEPGDDRALLGFQEEARTAIPRMAVTRRLLISATRPAMPRYDELFTAYDASPHLRKLFTTVLDETLPPEVEPFSFVPSDGMRLIAERLALSNGDRLLDLACGRGGPGMWIARETGTTLIGVDSSSVAVEQATVRRAAFGLEDRATFTVGEFGALAAAGIEDESVDGVVCVDGLQFAPDLPSALADLHRALRPGRRLVATCWEGNPPLPADLAGPLRTAGFTGVEVSEHPDWQIRQAAVFEAALAFDAAAAESDTGLHNLRREAEIALPQLAAYRRVLISAGKGQPR